jgi:cytochrome c
MRLSQERFSMKKFYTYCLACALAASPLALAAGPTQVKEGDVEKGKAVFEQCAVCHNADSTEKKMGPGLKGLFQKSEMANGKKPTEENVRAKIDEGGNGMPAYKEMLSDEEKDDLIAYLKTL